MKQILASGLLAAGLLASQASAEDVIRFAVTDIDGLEALQREMGPFKDAFEAASGLKVEFFPVSGRTVAVEAMAADQVDFVLTGPAEYVVFNARLDAQPVVTWQRPDYYSTVVVLDESPITVAGRPERQEDFLRRDRLDLAAPWPGRPSGQGGADLCGRLRARLPEPQRRRRGADLGRDRR